MQMADTPGKFEVRKDIRVGMPTLGTPDVVGRCLRNLLIGKGFHWQRAIRCELPHKIEILDDHIVNTLPIEEYLLYVVGSEMNTDSPEEFRKAHAIISRSWAFSNTLGRPGSYALSEPIRTADSYIGWEDSGDHHDDGFDVCSDDHCQRYQGIQPVTEEARDAIASTAGLVLIDSAGKIADARFYKCCGGHTELFSTCWQNHDYDYLPAKKDPYCDLSDLSHEARKALLASILKPYDLDSRPEHELWSHWKKEVTAASVSERLRTRYGTDIGKITSLHPLQQGPSGRIKLLEITGTLGKFTIGKELTLRRLLSEDCLMSSNFTAKVENGKIIMQGKGWGHGVGLCQIGAARMAADGADYREILSFYYPNTRITKLYD